MTYIIVSEQETVIDEDFDSYDQAFIEATRLFGDDPMDWIDRNIRVEEDR